MKRLLLVLGLGLAVGQAQAAPRHSRDIWQSDFDYYADRAIARGLISALVPREVVLEMWVTSRALMRRFGTTKSGWNTFVADAGEKVYGKFVGETADELIFEVRYLARADCLNAVRGRLRFLKKKVAKLVTSAEVIIVEQEVKVYLYASDRTVIEHRVEGAAPPEQKLLISLAPAQDQKADFRYGKSQFSSQNAVIGLLPQAKLSAAGGSASSASSSSSVSSAAAAENSGGGLAPPPANAPVDAAGAGTTAPPGP